MLCLEQGYISQKKHSKVGQDVEKEVMLTDLLCVRGRGVIMYIQSTQLDEVEIGRHHELYSLSKCFLYLVMTEKIKNQFTTARTKK